MDCSECDRLWRVYAFATRQHVEYIKAQEPAAHSYNIEKMRELETVVMGAEEWRELARLEIKMHEMTHELPEKNPTHLSSTTTD